MQKKVKKAVEDKSSPFGYQLVDRKPKPGVIVAAVFGLVIFMAFFYFVGTSVH